MTNKFRLRTEFNVMKYIYKYRILLVILLCLLFGLAIRILFLNSFPLWIGDEELELIINAKSIFLTGWDIGHIWSPFNATALKNIIPPITYLFLAPFVGPFPFSPIVAKIPFVFVHLSISILLYFIIKKIIGKKEALAVLVISIINPWSFFFSRTVFDAPLAVLFYFIAWVIVIYASNYWVLFAIAPILLAFYSYTGTKLILIPFMIGISYHAWLFSHNKKNTVPLILLNCACILLFIYQISAVQSEGIGQRVHELALPNSPKIIQSVNDERRLVISNNFYSIFSNKYVVYTKYIIAKYAEVFALPILFTQGEGRGTYSLYTHGYFYYIDLVFFFAGLLFLKKKTRSTFFLLLYVLLVGAIPAVVNMQLSSLSALRAALIYPIFCIFIGCGIASVIPTNKKRKAFVVTAIIIVYGLSLLNLLYIYFFRYPIYASEAYGFSKKLLVSYITLHQKNSEVPVIVYTLAPSTVFRHYIFANNLLERQTANQISKLITQPLIQYDNVIFADCQKYPQPLSSSVTIVESGFCEQQLVDIGKEQKFLNISQLSDAGGIYKIYNDSLCGSRKLHRYPDKIPLLAIVNGYNNKELFCDTFITDQFTQ